MSCKIEVDDDVFVELQNRAVPLVDSPNSVLRRLLGLPDQTLMGDPSMRRLVEKIEARQNAREEGQTLGLQAAPGRRREPRAKTQKGRARAPKGVLLPESEYELPILATLAESGGRAPTSELLTALEGKLDGKLKPLDREVLASGDIRWKNRAQFVRLKLVRGGDMKEGSPRGVWEISEQGEARLGREQH